MEEYYGVRPQLLKKAIRRCVRTKQNLLIASAPGTGKTEIVEQVVNEIIAENGGGDFVVAHPVCEEPTTYTGLGFPSEDRKSATFLPFGNLLRMIQAKRLLIVLYDDVGQSSDECQSAIMQVIRERSINGLKISDHVRFILCTNRKGDKAAVRGIIEPLKSRCVIINLAVNADDWRLWANSMGMPASLVAFSKLRPQLLHDFKPSTGMENSSNPRGWGEVGILQNDGLEPELEFPMYAGCCGEVFATEYTAFLKIFRSIKDPEKYLKNPNEPLPQDESILYALTAAISAMANRQNVNKVYDFAMRLEGEYSTFLVFSMIQRDKKLSENAGMGPWTEKFANYLL